MLTIGLLFGNIIAQQTQSSPLKPPEISAELRKNAVDFLRQTIKEIPDLKTEENRQYFMIETARLLWKYDEKEARKLFEQTINKINKLRSDIIFEAEKVNIMLASSGDSLDWEKHSRPLTSEQIYRFSKFRIVSENQKFLLNILISFDPEMAYQFLSQTPNFPRNSSDSGYYSSYQPRIVEALLEKNKMEKALAIAREILSKEFSSTYIDVLRRIYRKDSVKGRELAEETLQKIVSSTDYKVTTYLLNLFFDRVLESVENNPRDVMLSEKSLRELANLLGKFALTKYDVNNPWVLEEVARKIQKYSPQQSLQIRKALKKKSQPIVNANATNTATREYYGRANEYSNVSNGAGYGSNRPANAAPVRRPKSSKTPTPQVKKTRQKNEWEIREENRLALIKKLQLGKFTSPERNQILEEIKKYVFSDGRGYFRFEGYVKVINGLTEFAMASEDKEIAEKLIDEAVLWTKPTTKNYADYLSKTMIAFGYSRFHPEKSFEILEALTGINVVLENAIKLGEFVDMSSELISGSEVNLSYMLRDTPIGRQIFGDNRMIVFSILNLAKSDFGRTKSLASKFERAEMKMTARLLLLQTLLGEQQEINWEKTDRYYY